MAFRTYVVGRWSMYVEINEIDMCVSLYTWLLLSLSHSWLHTRFLYFYTFRYVRVYHSLSETLYSAYCVSTQFASKTVEMK